VKWKEFEVDAIILIWGEIDVKSSKNIENMYV
jgi:hypothetical protein